MTLMGTYYLPSTSCDFFVLGIITFFILYIKYCFVRFSYIYKYIKMTKNRLPTRYRQQCKSSIKYVIFF